MSKTTEYKDNAKEWRLRHESKGQITLATTEGYKNKTDMRESMINACIGVIDYYRNDLTEEQHRELSLILKSVN